MPAPDATRLAALRAAGGALRARSLEARVTAVGRALERVGDAGSVERLALEAALPEATGFAKETVRAGLELALEGWTVAGLRELVARELGGPGSTRRVTGFPLTGVLLGGALPMPTLVALAAPLVLGSPVLARTGSHDPVTAGCFARALAAEDPGLAAALHVVAFPHDDDAALGTLLSAECVVAYGGDATMEVVRARTTPRQRVVLHGHRVSVAVLSDADPPDDVLAAFARDVALWDQLGCLSPLALYVLGTERVPDALLDRLERAFLATAHALPRGRLGPEEAAEQAAAIGTAGVRAAADPAVRVRAQSGFTLVAERDAEFRGSPLHRFVRIHPVRDGAGLVAALEPLGPHLAAVGCGGDPTEVERFGASLAGLGASRLCPIGRMQAPPLHWCHDQRGVLLPLLRWTDVELDPSR